MKTILTNGSYSGKKLMGNLSPFWCIRVGGYRVIYALEEEIITVEVIKLMHRKEIY